jgi:hypothetical protein
MDMMKKRLLVCLLLATSCAMLSAADRYRTLLNAKHLTLTTQQGNTYYYIISADEMPMMRLGGDRVVVERDTFAVSDIRGMRLRTIPRFVLDEDSLTFGRDYAVDHGLLALRRTLLLNRWNAIVLPVELTGKQVREAFGDDAQVAQVRGFREGSNTTVDYELLSLDTREPVMLANCHYIIRPTREPDLEAGKTAPLFGSVRPEGPLYLIADATLETKQAPTIQTLRSDDRSAKLAVQGTYVVRGGQSSTNLKLPPGVYSFGDDGTISQSTDSVAAKAFSSWFVDTSDEPHAYSFYIDGINENLSTIEGIHNSQFRIQNSEFTIYDLNGRKVSGRLPNGQLKKGIYIINGKKVIVR